MQSKCRLLLLIIIFLFFKSLSIQLAAQLDFHRIVIDSNGPKDPFGKTVGDIDCDGFVDLIEGGYTDGGLVWYKNPGNPMLHWSKYLISEGGNYSTDHEVADIDRDGKPDLVVLKNKTISWFRNDGSPCDGGWRQTIIDERSLHDIEVFDYDGDGDVDIIGRHQDEWVKKGHIIHFYEQLEPNNWLYISRSCPPGEGLLAIDMDGDGRKDIVTGNKWYKNNGSMNGEEWEEFILSKSWKEINVFISAADINKDGFIDLVMTPSEPKEDSYHISWFEHPKNLKNEWKEHLIEDNVQNDYHFVGNGDFDLDGSIDIVAAEMHHGIDPDEVLIYLNKGKGNSWEKKVLWDKGSHSCRVFDCDNDGDLDIFGANYRGTEVNLWINKLLNPESRLLLDKWKYIQVDSNRIQKAFGLTVERINQVKQENIASGKWIYKNPGGNMDDSWEKIELPIDVDILLNVDVDNDEFSDFIAEDGIGQLYWFERNNKKDIDWDYYVVGSVGKANHGLSTQGCSVAQIEEDNTPEIIIVGGEQPFGTIYYFNIPENPEINEWERITVASPVFPEGVGIADLDGDGDIDLCSTSKTKNEVAWYENPGTPGNSNWKSHPVGILNGSDRFFAADIDGDSRVDIVVSAANSNENGVYWFKSPDNPKAGQWVKKTIANYREKNSMNSLDISDIDIDGDIDIVSGTHRGLLKVSVWENDGLGNFTEHIIDIGKESHLGTRLADLDGDGDLDIISIAWDKYQHLHLWRNDAINLGK